MAKTRDIVQEIAEVRQRRQFGNAMSELPLRLFALTHAFENHDQSNEELNRYFPVALVACIEGYVRLAVKDVIDSGEPYFSNAEKLAPTKLDFATLRAINGKAITVGELIAHSVPISRLEHIEQVFTQLLGGRSFLRGLRAVTDRWAHEVKGEPQKPILANPDEVFANIEKAFELRHIICHEIASAHEFHWNDISACFESSVSFLRAADEFISETMHPGAPLTQADMNIAAGEALDAKRRQLGEIIEAVKQRFPASEHAAFDKAHAAWEEYVKAWAEFAAGERATGGTIWPLVYASAAEEATDRRIEQLRQYRALGERL